MDVTQLVHCPLPKDVLHRLGKAVLRLFITHLLSVIRQQAMIIKDKTQPLLSKNLKTSQLGERRKPAITVQEKYQECTHTQRPRLGPHEVVSAIVVTVTITIVTFQNRMEAILNRGNCLCEGPEAGATRCTKETSSNSALLSTECSGRSRDDLARPGCFGKHLTFTSKAR